ncbi:B-box zinc finger protein 19 [Cocos nucifera]|uniref:B-box zinc finger protein 19 n=1 Tax=Cocos nucifera TaxID=13894 RepID=A0A8K0IV10_COCNU|nr:B-box zinc finger protein 19 [Cocos nucifera]
MKGCELCERAARIHCESDQASLCWECDAKVHGANFLVARHSRCLLCRRCQAPTPWKASGARFGPTVSVCERCCLQGKRRREDVADDDENGEEKDEDAEEDEGDDRMEEDDGGEEGEGEDEGEAEEEEEEGDNQVVPLSLTPPPVASSSSSEESSGRIYDGFFKRIRRNADLASRDDDIPCSSPQPSYLASAPARAVANDEATSFAGSSLGDRNKAALRGSSSSAQPAAPPAKSQPVNPKSITAGSSAAAILHLIRRRNRRAVELARSNSPSPPI